MQKQKGISTLIGIIIIIAVAVVAFGGVFGYQYLIQQKGEPAIIESNQNIVGNDRDAHGCIGSAGYTWCEVKQKCLRTWEEACVVDQIAGWKTYRNDEYGFEYPISGNVKTGYDWAPEFWPPQVIIFPINEDIVRACPISNGGYYNQLASSRKFVEIDGFGNPVTLYKLSYNGTKSGSLRYCYVVKSTRTENYIVYFEFTSTTDVDHNLEKDVDALTQKIISTFKFTK